MLWRAYALLTHGGDRIGLRPRGLGRPRRPFQTTDDILRTLNRIDESIWTANALAAMAEIGLIRELHGPVRSDELAARLSVPEPILAGFLDLLVSLGFAVRDGERIRAAPALAPFTTEDGARTFRAALRAPLLQTDDLRRRSQGKALDVDGWRFTDQAVIEAQGTLTSLWAERALPRLKYLPGLLPRLSRPGAALLDVGAGSAGLSITLCRHFPDLRAVALEPAPAPASVGERRVREEALHDRITIRRQRIEHLPDRDRFDLVFLPQMFLPDSAMEPAARNVLRSLRPGGWLLAAVLARRGHDPAAAVARLKSLLWGGNVRDGDTLKPLLAASGFDPVIRAPGGDVVRMICARRPLERSSLKRGGPCLE
jgi:SAM-dependent methyltransferase